MASDAYASSGFRRTLPFVLIALVVLAFANSFSAGLIFDNRVVILEDARVHALTLENLRLIFSRTYWWPAVPTELYRPLTTLTYLLNYAVLGNGASPFGYHAVNLLVHLTNVLLVFAVARRLARSAWPAFAVAAIWGVHPVLTEAVTNVVGRADLLAGFGVLAALWCHLHAGETDDPRRRLWWRIGTATAALAGVFAKESAIAVVAVIPLWDLLIARHRAPFRDVAKEWLAVVPAAVMFLLARTLVLAGQPTPLYPFVDNPIVGVSWWRGRLTAVAVIADYVRLVVWPASLSCDYSFPQIPVVTGSAADWMRWSGVAAVAALFIVVGRRSRALAFVLTAAFVVFLPASNLIFTTGTIMAERLVYLASIAPIAIVVALVAWASSRAYVPRAAVVVGLSAVIAVLAAQTVRRNQAWHDEVSLWTAAVEASPRSFKTHGALAEAMYQADPSRSNLAAVIAHKEQSLALLAALPDPMLVSDVYGQAATYYLERGDWLQTHEPARTTEAGDSYRAAAKWAALFVAAVDANRPGAQLPSARQRGEAQLLLSTATLKSDDAGAAVDAARRGRAADPFRAAAYQAEAAALVNARRPGDAAVTLLTGFMVTGETMLRSATMEMYRAGLDPAGCAVTQGPNGAILDLRCEIVHRHVCAASAEAVGILSAAGRAALAESTRRTALEQFACAGI